jgi:uncharacterized protein (DUF2252 family)
MTSTAPVQKRNATSKPHLTPTERAVGGREARTNVPRSSHAVWDPPSDRLDPVTILEAQAPSRVAELVPIRYGRMLTSPFAFYRGAAAIMAYDLSGTPKTGIRVQVCGDAHISNFGLFASPERSLLFDVNDFDETVPGPWEWDVKRLAASIAIAGRGNGFSDTERDGVLRHVAAGYRNAMASFAAMPDLDVWYSRLALQDGLPLVRKSLDKRNAKMAASIVDKARTKDSMQAFERLTKMVDGQRRIASDPPLIVSMDELLPAADADQFRESLHSLIRTYRRSLLGDRRHLLEGFRFVDGARKVVGVGSVGTRAYILLFVGRDDDDPLFLQAKEAQKSVLAPFAGKSSYANQGQRVVEGQRLLQAASDIFLGWDRFTGPDGVVRDFYVRQLRDWKGSWPPEVMDPQAMRFIGGAAAWTLARGHARSGDRIAIASYLGKSDTFDRAIGTFAEAYADQNQRDYEALQAAATDGKIQVESGL